MTIDHLCDLTIDRESYVTRGGKSAGQDAARRPAIWTGSC